MNQPQTVLSEPPPVVASPPQLPTLGASQDRCQECGSPMERQQRYCVNCAARRNDVSNPASRYFAASSRQRRQLATRAAAPPASTGGTKTAAVFFFALLPIAVAVGVLVGRSGTDSDNEALLAALREGNATAAVGAAGAADGSSENVSNPSELLASDFSLDKGFAVMLEALPIESTDQAAADEAVATAEDTGAKDVGIINPGDYATTPDQGQESYIVYSGEFKTKGEAESALTGLRKDFPDAKVIGLESSGASGAGDSDGGAGGRVLAETEHGTVHEVTAEEPTEEELEEGSEIVNEIASQTGDNYTDLQQELPDVIAVGGDPEDAPPLPTGAGD